MPTKTEAIKNFLNIKTLPNLAKLYNYSMEVQVNVAKGKGERFEGSYQGKQFTAWTDDVQIWKSFRIPWKANSNPEYNDSEIKFDLAEHCEGIGLTGWDWEAKKSRWMAFDFDAIVGHSDKHASKLTNVQLEKVQEVACEIPWVTVRRSTSGSGLHLYVFVDGINTANHNEHAALARSILAKMSAITGFDFNSRIDNCGHVMWIWHRKFDKAGGHSGTALEIIKQGEILTEIPINWKDHISVVSGHRKKNKPQFLSETNLNWFDQICGQNQKTPLDDEHKKLINFLNESDALWWFDSDHHMLVCHTSDLLKAHKKLGLRGIFETTAKGKSGGIDQNCFAFPQLDGVWAIRRHTPGVNEAATWDQDQGGWTRCYFNRDPDLKTIARANGAVEHENGSFQFQEAEIAATTAETFQAYVNIPPLLATRMASLKPHKDGRLIFEIETDSKVDPLKIAGWIKKHGKWCQILDTRVSTKYENELKNHDQLIRHLVSSSGKDAGWVIRADNEWKEEPLPHVKLSLKSSGCSNTEADIVMGTAILQRWKLVNIPFGTEYPGDRQWNKNAAQFAFIPTLDFENLNYPTWMKILTHCGNNLTPAILKHKWCQDNGILEGGEYLKLWIACMFQRPFEPLPYLFFYGLQGSGKSVFHEAIDLLMTRGVARADHALKSKAGFNGELQSAVLCVVEETDLRHDRSTAYDRIKDWTTGRTISIHIKGVTPYSTANSTHWVQMSNNIEACPIFPNDTRITMLHVDTLTSEEYIAKRDLEKMLKIEAPDFLASILSIEIPYAKDRLNIPVIETAEKLQAEKANQNEFEAFLEDQSHHIPGSLILWGELYDRFKEWLDPERRHLWTKRKAGQRLPVEFPKGRNMKDGAKFYVGNIAWDICEPDIPYILDGEKLTQIEKNSNVTI